MSIAKARNLPTLEKLKVYESFRGDVGGIAHFDEAYSAVCVLPSRVLLASTP